MPHRLIPLLLLAGVGQVGCGGGPMAPGDAGHGDASADGGLVATCASDTACGNQSLFCSQWRCRPGEPGTDARGCVDLGAPCEPGQGCDEERDVCGAPAWCSDGREGCSVPGDCDGDGARAIECGGNDCDDSDNSRSPTRSEVCDDVDNDCNPSTFYDPSATDWDRDGDGFASAMCSNGIAGGDDCDDAARTTYPGANEICDGADNDCDARIDEEPAGTLYYRDRDGDGYGSTMSVRACSAPTGYAAGTGDCFDVTGAEGSRVHPGADFGDQGYCPVGELCINSELLALSPWACGVRDGVGNCDPNEGFVMAQWDLNCDGRVEHAPAWLGNCNGTGLGSCGAGAGAPGFLLPPTAATCGSLRTYVLGCRWTSASGCQRVTEMRVQQCR